MVEVEVFGLVCALSKQDKPWADMTEPEREQIAKRVITTLHEHGVPSPMCIRLLVEAQRGTGHYESVWLPLGPDVRFNGAAEEEPQPMYFGTSVYDLDAVTSS